LGGCDHDHEALRIERRPFRPWSTFENKILAAVEAYLAAAAKRISKQIRESGPEEFDNDELWVIEQKRLLDTLTPQIEALAVFGVSKVREQLEPSVALTIDWDIANQNAATWAAQHAGDLSVTLTDVTKKRVRKQVSEWIESGAGLEDLVSRVNTVVDNPARARQIAITESTNAFANSNALGWVASGYQPAGVKPAYHVNCRCYLQPAVLADGTKVMVNFTARDELVCKTFEIQVPWKSEAVKGCRNMHTVVVSEGEYQGMKLADAQKQAAQKVKKQGLNA
jgi:hypothetical protein